MERCVQTRHSKSWRDGIILLLLIIVFINAMSSILNETFVYYGCFVFLVILATYGLWLMSYLFILYHHVKKIVVVFRLIPWQCFGSNIYFLTHIKVRNADFQLSNGSDYCLFFTLIDVKRDFFFFAFFFPHSETCLPLFSHGFQSTNKISTVMSFQKHWPSY